MYCTYVFEHAHRKVTQVTRLGCSCPTELAPVAKMDADALQIGMTQAALTVS